MSEKNFFEQVYALVALIPRGKVMTYGQIGEALQSPYSAKVVGYAMSCAPEERDLPCHRVVNRKGEMAPGLIFGGPARQRSRLGDEGVVFRDNGNIDLTQSLWRPEQTSGNGPLPGWQRLDDDLLNDMLADDEAGQKPPSSTEE